MEGGREAADLEHFLGLVDLGHLALFGLALLPGDEGVKGDGREAALLPQLGPLFLYLGVDIVVLVGAQDGLGLGCIIVRVQQAGVRQGKPAAARCKPAAARCCARPADSIRTVLPLAAPNARTFLPVPALAAGTWCFCTWRFGTWYFVMCRHVSCLRGDDSCSFVSGRHPTPVPPMGAAQTRN